MEKFYTVSLLSTLLFLLLIDSCWAETSVFDERESRMSADQLYEDFLEEFVSNKPVLAPVKRSVEDQYQEFVEEGRYSKVDSIRFNYDGGRARKITKAPKGQIIATKSFPKIVDDGYASINNRRRVQRGMDQPSFGSISNGSRSGRGRRSFSSGSFASISNSHRSSGRASSRSFSSGSFGTINNQSRGNARRRSGMGSSDFASINNRDSYSRGRLGRSMDDASFASLGNSRSTNPRRSMSSSSFAEIHNEANSHNRLGHSLR